MIQPKGKELEFLEAKDIKSKTYSPSKERVKKSGSTKVLATTNSCGTAQECKTLLVSCLKVCVLLLLRHLIMATLTVKVCILLTALRHRPATAAGPTIRD